MQLWSATEVATAIRTCIREEAQLTASAGIAPNKFLAKIASDWRKPDGQFVIRPAQVEAFLAPLPVSKLPGVGKVMEANLANVGVTTVGDLRTLGAVELERRFGRWGQRLHELSLGIDEHPVVSERPTLQVSAEDTFPKDLRLSEIDGMVRALASKVWAGALKEEGRIGRTVVLKLKTSDFRILTRSLTPPQPPASEQELIEIALSLRERVDQPSRTRYRLVGVGLGNFRDANEMLPQPELFGDG
jgi:DNA polymerase-4